MFTATSKTDRSYERLFISGDQKMKGKINRTVTVNDNQNCTVVKVDLLGTLCSELDRSELALLLFLVRLSNKPADEARINKKIPKKRTSRLASKVESSPCSPGRAVSVCS